LQIDILDDDIKEKLGTENPTLTPKCVSLMQDKESEEECYLVIGFEENVIARYSVSGSRKEVLISGPNGSQSQLVHHPRLNVVALVSSDKFLRLYSLDNVTPLAPKN
jgi:hypothetical protein